MCESPCTIASPKLTYGSTALEDSLSGSESSEDDNSGSGSDSDRVQQLLAKTRVKSRSPSPTEPTAAPRTSLLWFHSAPSTQIGFYRAILSPGLPENEYLSELRSMQTPVLEGRKWTMFMVAGGHFAGIVVRVSLPSDTLAYGVQGKGKQKKPIPELEILRHKTFHRYTSKRMHSTYDPA